MKDADDLLAILLASAPARVFGVSGDIGSKDGGLAGGANVSELFVDDAFSGRTLLAAAIVKTGLAVIPVMVKVNQVSDCNTLRLFHRVAMIYQGFSLLPLSSDEIWSLMGLWGFRPNKRSRNSFATTSR